MPKLKLSLPKTDVISYTIDISTSGLQSWRPQKTSTNIVIITDNTVKKLYGTALKTRLTTQGFKVLLLAFSAGEHSKTLDTVKQCAEQILAKRYGRDTLIVALGGGVVGDLAGFLAATYMRGLAYVQIPTTLLSMIDSSVGGKTAVNLPQGKNLLGAFWHPAEVIADISSLKTLQSNHLIAGLVEALKIFLTCNRTQFIKTAKNIDKILALDEPNLIETIKQSVKLKTKIVEQDAQEKSFRMILNFGHTIGHALEKLSDYKLIHGIAVGYGILVEAKIAEIMGLLSTKNFDFIVSVFQKLNIDKKNLKKYSIEKLLAYTMTDKKSRDQKARYILLSDLGVTYHSVTDYVHPVDAKIVRTAFAALVGT